VAPGANQRFVAATDQLDSGAPVVSVIGEVDRVTAPALRETLLAVTEEARDELIVDLTCCSFLDSAGLRSLTETKVRLERSNARMALVLSNPNVMRIFELTRSEALFNIYPSLDAALNGNGNSSAYA
jgi:anti-sigma B factor antagonist